MHLPSPLFDMPSPSRLARRLSHGDVAGPDTRCNRADRPMADRDDASASARASRIAARFAASLAFALVGCATPLLHPAVDEPGKFAAAAPTTDEPEAAWWDSYGDPVLSSLARRAARANRDVKVALERVRA